MRNHSSAQRSRRRTRAGTIAALVGAIGLVGSGVTPAAANHDPSGHQAHVGIVGGGYQGNPCSTYHSFDGTYVFDDGSVTVGTATYNGPIVVQYKESLTNSNSWHEFSDGSYASGTGCQTVAQGGVGPGVDWIPGFTMEITGTNSNKDKLTCTDDDVEYRRGRDLTLGVADPRHQNFRSNGADVSCTVTPNGAGSTSSTGSVASTQILLACSSPITPPTCTTKGGSITFSGF